MIRLDVKVETSKAVVRLNGLVASQAQIDKAVEVAKGVRGVREVQNKISVRPGYQSAARSGATTASLGARTVRDAVARRLRASLESAHFRRVGSLGLVCWPAATRKPVSVACVTARRGGRGRWEIAGRWPYPRQARRYRGA
jgi:hypothetical protein